MSSQSVFVEMATAVIDELEPMERTLVDPKVFTRIITICADTAEQRAQRAVSAPANGIGPPPMQFINASLLIPGDWVWQTTKLAFDLVMGVSHENGHITVTYPDDDQVIYKTDDPLRAAVSGCAAEQWNQSRTLMDWPTVKALYAAYGAS